jgi:hypothetical protein
MNNQKAPKKDEMKKGDRKVLKKENGRKCPDEVES